MKVRHWPRSHVKDGASAYRLDWEDAGLSFVWTGDGRPDELSAEYGKGADVFVTEGTIDTPSLSALKVGSPGTGTPMSVTLSAPVASRPWRRCRR